MAAAWRREKAGDWSEEGSGKELLVAPGIWDSSLLVSVNQNGERDWLLPVVIVIIVIVIVVIVIIAIVILIAQFSNADWNEKTYDSSDL